MISGSDCNNDANCQYQINIPILFLQKSADNQVLNVFDPVTFSFHDNDLHGVKADRVS